MCAQTPQTPAAAAPPPRAPVCRYDLLVGADGASSAVRSHLVNLLPGQVSQRHIVGEGRGQLFSYTI